MTAYNLSILVINSGLDELVKNLPGNDFKTLSQGFSGEFLKLVKQKSVFIWIYGQFQKGFWWKVTW